MIDEIKQRIEQVKAGRTPEGYRRTDIGVIPLDWKFKKLKNISKNIVRKNDGKEYKVLTISSLSGFLNQSDRFSKVIAGKSLDKYILLHKDEFAYNKGNSKTYPCGCIFRLEDYEKALVPNVYICFEITDGDSGYYKYYFINSMLNNQLKKVINSGVRNDGLLNLDDDDFYNCELIFPPLPEQKKIAEILATYDKVIELKERLIDEKKRQKKWLMQKLLNPESGVRLPGFTGKWEMVKIGNISEINPKSLSENTSPEYEFTYIDLSSTGDPEQIDFSRKILFKNAPSRARRIFEKNDILLSMVRPYLQNFIFVDFEPNDFICSTGFAVIHCEQNISSKYIFYVMFSESISRQIKKILVGTNYPAINAEDVKNLIIPLPPLSEQIAIADILFTADKEIALLKKELDETKQQKKALMQLLLTGIVRVK